ncbi:MAG: T9SS type A sorting domain-containing protein [Bacteroidota bacterium]|nr:T9SS type A sorting domain-containing protein [Bacteroidota bacterium]
MRYAAVSIIALFAAVRVSAQSTILAYDGIAQPGDAQLLAATIFHDEMQVVFNARFSPTEKCILEAVDLGFSVVKFVPPAGEDTLAIWVYEADTVPPGLNSVGRTYLFPLGARGIPDGNLAYSDPFSNGGRELRRFVLQPPLVFAPKRDFIVGVALLSAQRYEMGEAWWNGFSILVRKDAPEYERYRRYAIHFPPQGHENIPATSAARVSILLRAVVRYDATLPDTPLTDVIGPLKPHLPAIDPVYPQPARGMASVEFAVPSAGRAELAVYDPLGRAAATVFSGTAEAGRRLISFDPVAAGLRPGMYILRLVTDTGTAARSFLFLP